MRAPREHPIGPWLVAIGTGLWGTESAWRIPLSKTFSPTAIVFWEHVIMVVCVLPLVIPRLGELRRVRWQTLAWLMFSAIAGSAVGAVLFTKALTHGNPTVVNVVLNVQPILSTTAAFVFFGDRLARGFYPWAVVAVLSGMVLVGLAPGTDMTIDAGTGYALLCAAAWGMSTVAGRGIMVEMSLLLASGMRVVIGLAAMTVILAVNGDLDSAALWPPGAAAAPLRVVGLFLALALPSGGIPLVIYFRGLELTRASTAGYFEMTQTLSAVIITWAYFGAALTWYEVIAAVALMCAVAMVQRAQERTALYYPGTAAAAIA